MDGVKGEDYFSWDFKIKFSSNDVSSIEADSLIAVIESLNYKVTEKFQDEIFFKKTKIE